MAKTPLEFSNGDATTCYICGDLIFIYDIQQSFNDFEEEFPKEILEDGVIICESCYQARNTE